jgi:hypothetical protein
MPPRLRIDDQDVREIGRNNGLFCGIATGTRCRQAGRMDTPFTPPADDTFKIV